MTNCYLLTGAGFHHYWGGYLAASIKDYFLKYPVLKNRLWANKERGFEDILGIIQKEFRDNKTSTNELELGACQDAISIVFEAMDKNYRVTGLNFNINSYVDKSIPAFLAKFDGIFTLNQDSLLERHYLDEKSSLWLSRYSPKKLISCSMPGVQSIKAALGTSILEHSNMPRLKVELGNLNALSNQQSYIKLHGSYYLKSSYGADILVMGGSKEEYINSHEILKEYSKKFEECLKQPDTRLMIIGYGFGDQHINKLLEKVSKNLEIFIISPSGTRKIVDGGYASIFKSVVDASTASLNEIFCSNEAEFTKINNFILGK